MAKKQLEIQIEDLKQEIENLRVDGDDELADLQEETMYSLEDKLVMEF